MPTAIVAVTNDLTTDQRVHRTCTALMKQGFSVLLVGRRLRRSKSLETRSYQMHRMRLLFDKGPLFYAEYNLALFFFLITSKCNLLVSNDTDTLPAVYLAWRIKSFFTLREKSKPDHLHDCHEYFRGVPELVGRRKVMQIWKMIEDRIFPGLKKVMAVNESVARLYRNEYHIDIEVVRNVPFRKERIIPASRAALGIPPSARIILYQGAVNIGRGLEEAIMAMKLIRNQAVLLIAGVGDIFDQLRSMVEKEGLTQKVIFLGQVPFQQLDGITSTAELGLSIEKDLGINYHYCLPNKFLDYIQCGVPVLVSPFPEMKAIVDQYQIGTFLESHEPGKMAGQIDAILNDPHQLSVWKKNTIRAANDLCWENEERVIADLVRTDHPS